MKENELPEFLQLAIKHEEKVIELRKKQIDNYYKRIEMMKVGINYFDTFKKVPSLHGFKFPKEEYHRLKTEYLKQKKKS